MGNFHENLVSLKGGEFGGSWCANPYLGHGLKTGLSLIDFSVIFPIQSSIEMQFSSIAHHKSNTRCELCLQFFVQIH